MKGNLIRTILFSIFLLQTGATALTTAEMSDIEEKIMEMRRFLYEHDAENIFTSFKNNEILNNWNYYLRNINSNEFYNKEAHRISRLTHEWGEILRQEYPSPIVDSIVIDVSDEICYLFNTRDGMAFNNWGYEDRIVYRTTVAVGNEEYGKGTILGKFYIGEKELKPKTIWETRGIKIPYGHPFNSFGARKIELWRDGKYTMYSCHGTNDTTSIGKHISLGCIRFHNRDILIIYEMIEENKTVVYIKQ